MLGKLIHYETKAFGRIMLPLYGAALAFSLFMGLSIRFLSSDFLDGLPGLLMIMLYVMLLIAIMVMTGVLAVTRFYGNLLGKEGYLMFSLPAGTGSLISAKVISVMLWSMLSTITAFLTICLAGIGAGGLELLQDIPDLFRFLIAQENLGQAVGLTISAIIMMMLGAALAIVKIYAAIAVGHQFQNHRILGSVLAYVAFQIIETSIRFVFTMISGQAGLLDAWGSTLVRLFEAESVKAMMMVMLIASVLSLIGMLIYGILTYVLLDNKLNLE